MPTALLVGSDDAALADAGASLARDRDLSTDAELVLLLVGDPLDVGPWLALYSARARQLPVIVLLPFYDAHIAAQARACGALACHGLDQPVARLSETLAGVV